MIFVGLECEQVVEKASTVTSTNNLTIVNDLSKKSSSSVTTDLTSSVQLQATTTAATDEDSTPTVFSTLPSYHLSSNGMNYILSIIP